MSYSLQAYIQCTHRGCGATEATVYQSSLVLTSIPDAPRPVMWYRFCALSLQLLHGVVQEKVYQDGVHLGVWMFTFDLTLDELDTPDTASCTAGQSGFLLLQRG